MKRILVLLTAIGMIWILPIFAPNDPYMTNPDAITQPPSSAHLFGTDSFGRDVLSRVMVGGVRTVRIAVIAVVIAMSVGILIGLAAASKNPFLEQGIGLLIDSLLALPGFLLALVILTLVGTGEHAIAVAVGISQIAPSARLMRGAVIGVQHREYVHAAIQLGAPPLWIVRHHIIPNIALTVTAYAAVVFSYAILNGAALAFLGLGGDPSIPDWGMMLYEGRTAFRSAPWIGIFPGIAITGVILLAGWAARLNPRE